MTATESATRYMHRSEVADLYDVDEKTVDRWARRGRIPSLITPGGQRKYDRRTIEADYEQRRNGPSEFSSLTDD